MKAWRFYDFGDMRLDEVPDPEVRPGWVVSRVRRVQPSITDAQRAMGIGTVNATLLREQLKKYAPVQLLGHEMSAEVLEVGKGVEDFRPGDIVCTSAHVPCGKCIWCQEGREAWCDNKLHIGINLPGAFAELIAMPAAGLVKVPKSLDDASVACLQPLSSAVAAMRDIDIRPGESVAITGQGVMGLYTLQIARTCGASVVYVSDVKEESFSLSRKFGADAIINAREEDPVERVRELTGGKGVDIAFECAGGTPDHGLSGHETLHQALRMVRLGGRVMQVAGLVGEVNMEPIFMRAAGIRWIFPEGHGRDTVALGAKWVASGRLDVRSLITHEKRGIGNLPDVFEITQNKDKYKATNPCQLVLVE